MKQRKLSDIAAREISRRRRLAEDNSWRRIAEDYGFETEHQARTAWRTAIGDRRKSVKPRGANERDPTIADGVGNHPAALSLDI